MNRKIMAGFAHNSLSMLPCEIFAAAPVHASCPMSPVKTGTSPTTSLPDAIRSVSLV